MPRTANLPSRLHHTAYTTKDMEKTRTFYEELIRLPLVATWSESDKLFGKVRTYCHCFFGLGDGGALAFFDQATQEAIEKRIEAAGYKDPDTFVLEHGYCRSVYIKDPNGLILEFTLDAPNADQIAQDRMADAPATLARWLSGDHTSNNTYR